MSTAPPYPPTVGQMAEDDDDEKTVYPTDEGPPNGDDVWLETPHPDDTYGSTNNADEDFDTYLPEDVDMIAMLEALEEEGAAHSNSNSVPPPASKKPPAAAARLMWAGNIPDYTSHGEAVGRELPPSSRGPMCPSDKGPSGVTYHAFFVPLMAYTEMFGSVEAEHTRTMQEQQRRAYISRRRAQAFTTFTLRTAVQRLPSAEYRVVTPSMGEGLSGAEEGYYTYWELHSTRTHPAFHYFKGPPFNPSCTLFTEEDYDGREAGDVPPASVRSPTSSTTPTLTTIAVDGGVCVPTWKDLAFSRHWGVGLGGQGRGQATELGGNRSIFGGIPGGTVPTTSPQGAHTCIILPARKLSSPPAGGGEIGEVLPLDAPSCRSNLAAVFGQRAPVRGWKGSGAEAGANAAVQLRPVVRLVDPKVMQGYMQPPPPVMPSWLVGEGGGAAPEPTAVLDTTDLRSGIQKLAALVGSGERSSVALLAALEELGGSLPTVTRADLSPPSADQ